MVDSASTEKDDRADLGSYGHSQQSGRGGDSFYSGSNGGGASSGAGASGGSANKTTNGTGIQGNKLHAGADVCFTPTMPLMPELRRVSSDDDDHTILQDIITSHQRDLSASASAGNTPRHTRGKGSILSIASASAGRGVRTRGMLENAPIVRTVSSAKTAALKVDAFPVATGLYHPVTVPRFVPAASVHSPRCSSAMSGISADGTDNEASSASPANVLHLNAHDMSYIDHAVQRCESTNSLGSETAPLSKHFASASLLNQTRHGAFTSLSSLTPSRSLPGPFPALAGLSSGALRHLGVESYTSPPTCRVGEVPLFQHPDAPLPAPRRPSSAASNVSNSSGCSSVHETTSLRRNYFSALEEHLIAESHSGEMAVNQEPPRGSGAVLGSPLLPHSSFSVGPMFTPNANTPFQVVRRVSLGEETEMMSGCTTQGTTTGSSDSMHVSKQGLKQVTFTRGVPGASGKHFLYILQF